MWIRSQNRNVLVNADKFSVSKEHEVFRIYSVNYFLGEYSTEEKAMKVMDMIQNAITGTRFEFTDIIRDCDLAGIEIHNAFNMPQDSEVKEMKWIPVSERLPNRHQRVLCYFKYEPESPDIISENTYIGSGMWMSESDKVDAWMPLPEPYTPYKGEHNEKH